MIWKNNLRGQTDHSALDFAQWELNKVIDVATVLTFLSKYRLVHVTIRKVTCFFIIMPPLASSDLLKGLAISDL